jgi:hypothetical protein
MSKREALKFCEDSVGKRKVSPSVEVAEINVGGCENERTTMFSSSYILPLRVELIPTFHKISSP